LVREQRGGEEEGAPEGGRSEEREKTVGTITHPCIYPTGEALLIGRQISKIKARKKDGGAESVGGRIGNTNYSDLLGGVAERKGH